MSPELKAIELMSGELGGVNYENRKADITQFLIRAEQELTPEDHEKFRASLLRIKPDGGGSCTEILSFDTLFAGKTGLKVDFNKFVGSEWKIGFASDIERREAAALGADNVGQEQSSPEADPSGSEEISAESCNSNLSSLSEIESEAAPRTFAEFVPEQSPE